MFVCCVTLQASNVTSNQRFCWQQVVYGMFYMCSSCFEGVYHGHFQIELICFGRLLQTHWLSCTGRTEENVLSVSLKRVFWLSSSTHHPCFHLWTPHPSWLARPSLLALARGEDSYELSCSDALATLGKKKVCRGGPMIISSACDLENWTESQRLGCLYANRTLKSWEKKIFFGFFLSALSL